MPDVIGPLPAEERTFAGGKLRRRRVKREIVNTRGARCSNYWPGTKLDYAALERAKELVCRIAHPTSHLKKKNLSEYRVSILRWSRGAYIDIRTYHHDKPTGRGILLHQDIASVLIPEVFYALRTLEQEDMREEEQKAKVEAIRI